MTVTINGTTGITSPAETVGSTITYADTGILATYASSSTSYNQVILQNSNSGTASSTDVIVSNDQGTASTYYGDFGMNSSGWTGSLPFSAANVVYLTSTSGPLSLGSVTSNPVYIATNSTTAVTIDTSQNVGIGTSSPTALGTYPTLDIRGSAGGGLRVGYSTVNGYLYADSGGMSFGTATNNALIFATNSVERMRMDSSGNLLVGGTANPNSGKIVSNVANSARFMSFINNSNSAEIGYIQNNSGTATIYSTSSDYRLKENVVPMTGALEKVLKLNPVTYTWKSNGVDGQGFIAHELQEIVPDAVCGIKDEVNEEGNPVYQGIDTSFLVATLTAAIQELNATITDLQAKLKSAGVAGF